MTAVYVILWLIAGYAWTYIWVNHILDNRRFADTGNEPGPIFLLAMTLVGPLMVALYIVVGLGEMLFHNIGPTIKRLYGIK